MQLTPESQISPLLGRLLKHVRNVHIIFLAITGSHSPASHLAFLVHSLHLLKADGAFFKNDGRTRRPSDGRCAHLLVAMMLRHRASATE